MRRNSKWTRSCHTCTDASIHVNVVWFIYYLFESYVWYYHNTYICEEENLGIGEITKVLKLIPCQIFWLYGIVYMHVEVIPPHNSGV